MDHISSARNGGEKSITEGDAVHLPSGTPYHIQNPHGEWLTYMIIAG